MQYCDYKKPLLVFALSMAGCTQSGDVSLPPPKPTQMTATEEALVEPVKTSDVSELDNNQQIDNWNAAWSSMASEFGVKEYYTRRTVSDNWKNGKISKKYIYMMPYQMWNQLSQPEKRSLIEECANGGDLDWEFVLGRVVNGDILYDHIHVTNESYYPEREAYSNWHW